MNTIAAAGNQLGALAALLPQPATNTAPATPVFLNLISALFGPQVPDAKLTITNSSEPFQSDPQLSTKDVAAPKQIAEVMIRSMLGDGTALGSALPAVANPGVSNKIAIAPAVPNIFQDQASKLVPGPVSESPLSPAVAEVPLTALADTLTQVSTPVPAKADTSTLRMPASPATALKALKSGPKIATPSKLDMLATTTTLPVPVAVESLPPVAPGLEGNRVTAPGASLQALPLPGKTVEPDAAPALPSELAFSARLTPIGSSEADSPGNLAPEHAPAASTPAAAQPVSLIETAVNQPKPQLEESPAPAPAPVAPPKELAGRASATEQLRAVASDVRTKAPAQPDDAPIWIVAAAATSSAGDFNRPFEAPVAPPAPSASAPESKPEMLFTTAETLRTSEPQSIAPPPAQTSAVQEIAVRIARPEAPPVELHVTQRGGEIQVSVHTPDTALQTSLREDLNTLTNSLERAGYHTETVVPRGEGASQMNSRDDRQPQQDPSGRGGSGDAPGGSRDGRRQQQNQNQRDQRSQRWLDELETQK